MSISDIDRTSILAIAPVAVVSNGSQNLTLKFEIPPLHLKLMMNTKTFPTVARMVKMRYVVANAP